MNREGLAIENIRDLQGLNNRSPWLAFGDVVNDVFYGWYSAVSGLFAKLGVLEALVQVHLVWLATLALVFAIIGAYYYIAVVKVMYFEEPTVSAPISLAWMRE